MMIPLSSSHDDGDDDDDLYIYWSSLSVCMSQNLTGTNLSGPGKKQNIKIYLEVSIARPSTQ